MSVSGEKIAVRGRRVRRHRRSARIAAIVCGVIAGLCALAVFGGIRASKREAEANAPARPRVATGAPVAEARPVYPYSVIAGGARSGDELTAHVKADAVVREHYQEFDLSRTKVVRLATPRTAYVSYRRGSDIFWTRKPVTIPAGETVLTDGRHMARTRCGNRIEDTPGRVSVLEPLPHELDVPHGTLSPSGPSTVAGRFVTADPFSSGADTSGDPAAGPGAPLPRPPGVEATEPGVRRPRTGGSTDTPSAATGSDRPDDADPVAPQFPYDPGTTGAGGHAGDPSTPPIVEHGGPPHDDGPHGDRPHGDDPGDGGGDPPARPDPPGETRPPGPPATPPDGPHPPLPPLNPPGGGDVPNAHWPPEGEGGSGTVPEPGLLLLIAGGGAVALRRRRRAR